MTQPWHHDQRMLAAGNARRRPAGEIDLPQPSSAREMPRPPGPPLAKAERKAVALVDASTLADRLVVEARRVGISPVELARLYALTYSQPVRTTRTFSIRRMFSRKAPIR